MEDYAQIRRALRDGMTIRVIARLYGHSPKTILKAKALAEPPPYQRGQPHPCPVLGPYQPIIEQILAEDQHAPPKQRHTMAQVYRRLVDEHGYAGSYDAVRRWLGKRRRAQREVHLPLDHEAGERLECDFGHSYADLPEGRTEVPVFVCTWSWSNAPFALALPTERVEAVLAGMVAAFGYYGGVPREVWWDNPKTIAVRIGRGRERVYHPRYLALASYYCFEPCACLPARPQEKPRAENQVYDLQRRWATPVPKAADLAALNAHLLDKCLKERKRAITGQTQTIGERWQIEQAVALPLPPRPFEPCVYQEALVDKYQSVRFDTNRYSVPHTAAFAGVTIRATIDEVVILQGGTEVARHSRSYGSGEQILDPYHYLPILDRRPAALDKAGVFRRWRLPPVFERLREALELRHGLLAGKRQYIRVLQLLGDHPLERVEQVVTQHLARDQVLDAALIRLAVERRAPPTPSSPPPALDQVQVPRPDLAQFDQLLTSGGAPHA